MRKTTNYGLSLYDKEDKMIITANENSLNANMEIIDKTLKDNNVPSHVKAITQADINKWNSNDNNSSKKKYHSIGIIGDSYSAYKGWIPSNYNISYGQNNYNGLTSVKQMWWWILADTIKATILRNSSYSGSTICNTGYNGEDATSSSFLTRAETDFGLTKTLEAKPDLLFVFGGTNDDWAKVEIGNAKYSDWSTEDLKQVAPAFCKLISNLTEYNPGAKIVFVLNNGLSESISAKLKEICNHYSVLCVELTDIEKENSHPSINGMVQIANQILTALGQSNDDLDDSNIPATGITLNKNSLEFTSSSSQTLIATVQPSNATDKVAWLSNNNGVATVSNGVVSPISNGSAIITAKAGNYSATCSVTVNIEQQEETTTYTVTNNLTNVTSSNEVTSILEGSTYNATLSADSGYTLENVTVTMGGANITSSSYSNGVINIPNATGDIVIPATAKQEEAGLSTISTKTLNYTVTTSSDVAYETHDVDYKNGDTIRVEYKDLSNVLTDSSVFYLGVDYQNGIIKLTPNKTGEIVLTDDVTFLGTYISKSATSNAEVEIVITQLR